ncbi:MAG: hypothetical protein OXR62_11695 [Ahrensia sp.]|nr:hypothetical protein [Ahrensia sp.]
MSKYDPLGRYLAAQTGSRIVMSFVEIEKLLNFKLPKSSRNRAWWSNNKQNSVMTKVWIAAGFKTEEVDMAAERLVFRRVSEPSDADGGATGFPPVPDQGGEKRRHPIFGCMKGMITIPDDLDLTAPADPDWGRVYD